MRLCAGSSFNFIGSYGIFNFSCHLSLCGYLHLVRMTSWYFSFTALCSLCWACWSFAGLARLPLPLPPPSFSFASCRSAYRRLVFYVCGLSRMSWTSLLVLLLSGLFRVFLYLCATISSPLSFFSFGLVSSVLVPSSFHLPSCLAAASQIVLSPWHTTSAVNGLLAAGHTVPFLLVVGSFRWAFAVFCYGHPFLQCLLAFENSFNSVGFSLVFFEGSLGPLDFIRILGFPPLTPPCSTLLVVVSSSRLALLLPVSPSSTASTCHQRHMLSLFHFPASFGDTVHILLSAPSIFVRFLLFCMTYCSFSSCSFFRLFSWVLHYPGFSLSICDCLRSSWGSRLPPSSWVLLMFLFFRTSVFLLCDFLSTASFSIGFHLRSFSVPAFARCCLLSSHALLFLSLGVLVLSAILAFPHFSYTVHGFPSSFFPSCSSLPFRSLGALLPQSNLRFPLRQGPPFGPGQFPIRFFALLYGWLFFAVP